VDESVVNYRSDVKNTALKTKPDGKTSSSSEYTCVEPARCD